MMATLNQPSENTSPDRRKFPRFAVSVPIELLPEGAAVAAHTQTSELSLGGCYLETQATMAVGTELRLVLWIEGEKLTPEAVIATQHPGFGNGMRFVNMSPEDEAVLIRYLDSLESEDEK